MRLGLDDDVETSVAGGRARAAVGAVAEEETHEGLVEEDAGDVEWGEVMGEAGGVEVDLRGKDADDGGVVGRDEAVHQRVGNQILRRVRQRLRQLPETLLSCSGGEEGEDGQRVQRGQLERRGRPVARAHETVDRPQHQQCTARRVGE